MALTEIVLKALKIRGLFQKKVEELLKDPSLKGNVYKTLKPDEQNPDYTKRELKIMSMFSDMDRFTATDGIGFPLFKGFENFRAVRRISCSGY